MSSYALVGNTWPIGTTTISFTFATSSVNGNPLSSEITDPTERALIADAFAAWTSVTGIHFAEAPDGSVSNIRLGFGDNLQTAGVLGLTTLSYGSDGIIDPTSSYIRLEDPSDTLLMTGSDGQLYYDFSGAESQDATFEQLAIHEIGHVLGFADNSDPDSIEDMVLDAENRTFDTTDLEGAQALYPTTAASVLPEAIPTQTSAAVPLTLFTINDTTSGATTSITSDAYDGPLSFLSHDDAFSYNGSDNVDISAASATNPLMASGSGNDRLTGTSTGSSVLDGGTGANILTDGGNANTTFVQNGYVAGSTWDFIQNFHGSDEDIIFGFIPGVSRISVEAHGGAGSYTGLSVIITPGNGNVEEATFIGASESQIRGTSAVIDGVPSWVLFT